ncbi:hypothetical protein [Streptomyces sp. I05A-00742]|uniref:hypothetical protein n=1 Tax=Streptomyces sp. I05A-00742 TaxID=2732853 RepID=UPI0014897CAB|nr:hypothetical protein [Streptomyces sp. I05A-00742]
MELLDVLAELARSGHLGPVENGAAWDQVTAALGEPWEVEVGKRRSWPRLCAYGDLELSVCRCRKIAMICLQTWRDVIDLPAGLVGREKFPGQPQYADVTAALDRAGCAWQPYPPLTFDNQCAVRATSSGVVFVFEILDGEGPILNVVGPPPHRHECSATHATP